MCVSVHLCVKDWPVFVWNVVFTHIDPGECVCLCKGHDQGGAGLPGICSELAGPAAGTHCSYRSAASLQCQSGRPTF